MSRMIEKARSLVSSDEKENFDEDFVYFWDDVDQEEYVATERKSLSETLDDKIVLVLHLLILLPILLLVIYVATVAVWAALVSALFSSAAVFLSYLIVRNRYIVPHEILSANLVAIKENSLTGKAELLFSLEESEILSDFNEVRMTFVNLLREYEGNTENLEKEIQLMQKLVSDIYRGIDQVNLGFDNTVASPANYQEVRGYLNRVSKGVDHFTENFDSTLNSMNEMANILRSIGKQTTMLALNAGIEAAKAGNAGRGFEVVASNLRRLAQHAIDSSTRILDTSSEVSERAKVALEEITEGTIHLESMIDSNHEIVTELNSEIYGAVNDLNGLRTDYNRIFNLLQKNLVELDKFEF